MKLPKLTFLVPFVSFFVLAWLLVIRANIHEGRAVFLLVICLLAMLLTHERKTPFIITPVEPFKKSNEKQD